MLVQVSFPPAIAVVARSGKVDMKPAGGGCDFGADPARPCGMPTCSEDYKRIARLAAKNRN
jgi:hypothetical protein